MSSLPEKTAERTATVDLRGRPKYLQPAPFLLLRDGGGGLPNKCCSDCGAKAIVAGDGDLEICPKCYALLWHKDYGDEQRRLRRERDEQERLRLAQLRKTKAEMKARARDGAHQLVSHQQVQMTLKSKRRRLVELIWARASTLYAWRHGHPN
jgi:uncharacterized Zn finger protein (UPF0148 family)